MGAPFYFYLSNPFLYNNFLRRIPLGLKTAAIDRGKWNIKKKQKLLEFYNTCILFLKFGNVFHPPPPKSLKCSTNELKII